MKKMGMLGLVLALLFVVPMAMAGKIKPVAKITDGTLTYTNPAHYLYGEPLTTGFDIFGYNYQAHLFVGWYENYLPTHAPVTHEWGEPGATWLVMKWNDAWLSNADYDGDGVLDRHVGYDDYFDSGAWETNHMIGWYEEDGVIYQFNYFCKIVAASSDWDLEDGYWYDDGTEIGEAIWGQFAVIFQVSNDPYLGEHGVLYNAPGPTGFGYYTP